MKKFYIQTAHGLWDIQRVLSHSCGIDYNKCFNSLCVLVSQIYVRGL